VVAVIDNYDSFVYNLVQYLGEMGMKVEVYRNDALSAENLEERHPGALVVSPGPGRPEEAGISEEVIERLIGKVPLLGVCLGHQCMGRVFGARIVEAQRLMHGKTCRVRHRGGPLYQGLPNPFTATRYHSLVVEPDSVPSCLEVEAWSEEGEIMGLRYRDRVAFGVQFHPESILTPQGMRVLYNFFVLAGLTPDQAPLSRVMKEGITVGGGGTP